MNNTPSLILIHCLFLCDCMLFSNYSVDFFLNSGRGRDAVWMGNRFVCAVVSYIRLKWTWRLVRHTEIQRTCFKRMCTLVWCVPLYSCCVEMKWTRVLFILRKWEVGNYGNNYFCAELLLMRIASGCWVIWSQLFLTNSSHWDSCYAAWRTCQITLLSIQEVPRVTW
jgi:hypothetical protein